MDIKYVVIMLMIIVAAGLPVILSSRHFGQVIFVARSYFMQGRCMCSRSRFSKIHSK